MEGLCHWICYGLPAGTKVFWRTVFDEAFFFLIDVTLSLAELNRALELRFVVLMAEMTEATLVINVLSITHMLFNLILN
jgi:hypothetical protein